MGWLGGSGATGRTGTTGALQGSLWEWVCDRLVTKDGRGEGRDPLDGLASEERGQLVVWACWGRGAGCTRQCVGVSGTKNTGRDARANQQRHNAPWGVGTDVLGAGNARAARGRRCHSAPMCVKLVRVCASMVHTQQRTPDAPTAQGGRQGPRGEPCTGVPGPHQLGSARGLAQTMGGAEREVWRGEPRRRFWTAATPGPAPRAHNRARAQKERRRGRLWIKSAGRPISWLFGRIRLLS